MDILNVALAGIRANGVKVINLGDYALEEGNFTGTITEAVFNLVNAGGGSIPMKVPEAFFEDCDTKKPLQLLHEISNVSFVVDGVTRTYGAGELAQVTYQFCISLDGVQRMFVSVYIFPRQVMVDCTVMAGSSE